MLSKHFVPRMALAIGLAVGTSGWSHAQDVTPAAVGLNEIFPDESPDGIKFGDLDSVASEVEEVSPEWAAWVNELDPLLQNLYLNRGETLEAQQAAVDALASKVAVLGVALADPAYHRVHPVLTDLRQELAIRVSLADAILGFVSGELPATPETRSILKNLVSNIDQYLLSPRVDLEQGIRADLTAIEQAGGHGVVTVVRNHLLNTNMRVVITEGLLNRLFAEERHEKGGIRDKILQACVYGYQCTNSTLHMDLQPCDDAAVIELQAQGTIYSRTTGYTKQAKVASIGNHSFKARKPVRFDGEEYQTHARAMVTAYPNVKTVDAVTKFTRVPILGKIADNIAYNEAVKQTPQVNSITAGKIIHRVGNQMDREAGQQFAEATEELQNERYAPLRKYGMYPEYSHVSSTDLDMGIVSRLMTDVEVGGSEFPPYLAVPTNGAAAQIHESLLSNGFDGIGLAGQTMTATEVRNLLQDRFSEILGRDVKLEGPEEGKDTGEQFVFAEQKPVWFQFRDGRVIMKVFASLITNEGTEIPQRLITVALEPTLEGDNITLTRKSIRAENPDPLQQETRIQAAGRNARIVKAFTDQLPETRTESALVDVEADEESIQMRITSLTAAGGWLTITLE
ncbi:MAG: hypothetical protein KDA80_11145 [Planctomycetaceae bacterium]|nr:hypothetical protein [Planctomycetaceae bacterium]